MMTEEDVLILEDFLKDLEMKCYLYMIQKEKKFECVYVSTCGKLLPGGDSTEENKNIH